MVLQVGYPEMDRAFPINAIKSNGSQYTENEGAMQTKGLKSRGKVLPGPFNLLFS